MFLKYLMIFMGWQMVIYKTINMLNSMIYVGRDAENDPEYLGSGVRLDWAMAEFGRENFRKEILENCTPGNICEREIYWIAKLDACNPLIGYNILPGGEGFLPGNTIWKGRKHKPETIEKMRGRKHTKDELEKMRLAASLHRHSPETIAKLKGRPKTEEAKANMRGKHRTQEMIAKARLRRPTELTRARLREGQRRYRASLLEVANG